MQEQTDIKKYIGVAAVVALLAFSFAAVRYVLTYDRVSEPGSYRSFSVSGDGKAVAIPDVAQFTFEVVSEGGIDLASLQQENTKKVNSAVAFVKSKGVAEKDIQTQGYNVEPRYQYFDCSPQPVPLLYYEENASGDNTLSSDPIRVCPPSKIAGYNIRATVSVKIRNFAEVGSILSGVVTNGANNVSGLQFAVDDPTLIENEARAKAIAKAKSKAEALADAGNFKLGRLISINEGGPGPYYDTRIYAAEAYGKGGDGSVPVPTIEPGSQEFNITISLTYEIR